MRKINITLPTLLLATAIAWGCKNKPSKAVSSVKTATEHLSAAVTPTTVADTIATKHIHEVVSDSICLAEIEVDYPTNGPQSVLDSIRISIAKELRHMRAVSDFDGNKDYPTYKGNMQDGTALAKFYTRSCYEGLKNLVDSNRPEIQLEQSLSIERRYESDKIVTLVISGYAYSGGAHGMGWRYGTMFDKANGKQISYPIIDSTKVQALQPQLEKGLKEYFKNEISITNGNIKEMLQLDSDLIPLPASNPYFTESGVTFIYGQYEIGAYAIGMPTFTLPYKDIYPFLTPQAKKLVTLSNKKE